MNLTISKEHLGFKLQNLGNPEIAENCKFLYLTKIFYIFLYFIQFYFVLKFILCKIIIYCL